MDAVWQCAWCRRFYRRGGLPGSARTIPREDARSHGICPECAGTLYRRREQEKRDAGDLLGAERVRHRRLRIVGTVIRAWAADLRKQAQTSRTQAGDVVSIAHALIRSTRNLRAQAASDHAE